MVFWIAIIAGLAGAFFGIKKQSFYAVWAILFNLMVSIYLSVMVARPIVSLLDTSSTVYGYHLATSMLLIAAVFFTILQIIAVSFFTSYGLEFSEIFDKAGSAALGFIIGFLACSYIFFIICVMPVSNKSYMSWLNGPDSPPKQTALIPVVKTCDIIAKVSLQRYDEFKDADSLVREIIAPDKLPEQPVRQQPKRPTKRNRDEDNIEIQMLFPD